MRLALIVSTLVITSPTIWAEDFFEAKIRPVLVEQCYKCHAPGGKGIKGGLRLDSRTAMLTGGDTGPAIVPKDAAKGTLIDALRYKNVDLQMPPSGKLSDAVIKDFETWINTGAVWPGDSAMSVAKDQFDLAARKASHWAWKPVVKPAVPQVQGESRDDVDKFWLAKLEAKKLTPAPDADPATWLRRASFAVTGLPPTPEDLAAFRQDFSPAARAKLLDRWLASTAYAERWARHWLDVVRYAESRGHEFDPDIANIHHYRDYVIRAFRDDVPYDQFVREHIAGDVLPKPRHSAFGHESIIGTAFWHLGEEVHSPVDIRQDQADRFDNRIDVFSKAFLGLTVSCARCHDHKFDAITAKDYTALFGLLEGSSFRQARINTTGNDDALLEAQAELVAKLPKPETQRGDEKLTAWLQANGKQIIANYATTKANVDGPALRSQPAGNVSLTVTKDAVLAGHEPRAAVVYDRAWDAEKPAAGVGLDGHALSKQLRAGRTLRTPMFTLNSRTVFALVRGGGMAYAAVNQHIIVMGPLHGALVTPFADAPDYRWVRLDLANYVGKLFHLEFSAQPGTDFAVAMVVQTDTAPPNPDAASKPFAVSPDIAKPYRDAVAKWQQSMVPTNLVPALWDGEGVDAPVFIRGNPRAPGEVVPHRFLESLAGPQKIAHTSGSGRYELALQVTDPRVNPFFDRVIVNRIWHHLFGRGLVPTPDNFGVLGEKPSHPELLDYLATEFAQSGRQFKPFIKRLMLTRAYAMSSRNDSDPADAANELLHHFRVKRLEGEAIRDAMLTVAGALDPTPFGPPVPIYLTPFLEGRGRPTAGPLDGHGRRSIYLSTRRNFLSPFMQAFDTPIPFSTVGKRQVSNVPAQALILLNDPFVHKMAEHWGQRTHGLTPEARVKLMYQQAFCRDATPQELEAALEFVTSNNAWPDLAHALFNVKEFIFVR
jgi:Protein of unknown function (DUF1549)/Protein of unknown function (DUF1553)/Planctomycete cytochrome C